MEKAPITAIRYVSPTSKNRAHTSLDCPYVDKESFIKLEKGEETTLEILWCRWCRSRYKSYDSGQNQVRLDDEGGDP